MGADLPRNVFRACWHCSAQYAGAICPICKRDREPPASHRHGDHRDYTPRSYDDSMDRAPDSRRLDRA
jgi:hypothetical protein